MATSSSRQKQLVFTLAVRSVSDPAGVGSTDQWFSVDKSIAATAAVRRRVAVREV